MRLREARDWVKLQLRLKRIPLGRVGRDEIDKLAQEYRQHTKRKGVKPETLIITTEDKHD